MLGKHMELRLVVPIYGWGWQINGASSAEPPSFRARLAKFVRADGRELYSGRASELGHALDGMYLLLSERGPNRREFGLVAGDQPYDLEFFGNNNVRPLGSITGFAVLRS